MLYLTKKMLQDFKTYWMQFLSVFLMAAISVLIFSGMASVWTGLDNEVKEYIKESNLPNYWIKAINISEEDIKSVEKIDGIESVTAEMKQSFSIDKDSELLINATDNLLVGKPILIEGEPYNAKSEDGIWIDKSYAKEHKLKIRDKIVTDEIKKNALTVRGFIMTPEYIYYTGSLSETIPNYEKYGYAFCSVNAIHKIDSEAKYSVLKITTNKPVDIKKVEKIFGKRFIAAQDRSEFIPYYRVEQESEQMQKMATLFSVVFILLALLTMYTSMVRLVNHQRVIIGTLKALGISRGKIRFHYAAYGLVVPALGCIAGLVAGRFTVSQALLRVKKTTIYIPEWELVHSKESFVLIAIILLSSVFASMWATQRCLKDVPAETMRNKSNKEHNYKEASEKGFMSKLSYASRWTLRNISHNKIRFTMGIIGVLGGMVLIISGIGVKDAIRESNNFVFNNTFKYENKVMLNDFGSYNKIDDKYNHQWIAEKNIELKYKDDQVKQTLLTICDSGDLISFYNNIDEIMKLPDDGVVISRKLANDLGISNGDLIKMRIFGDQDWIKVEIKNTTKILSPQGVYMNKDAYEKLDKKFLPSALLTENKNKEFFLKNDAVQSVISKNKQIDNTDRIAESVLSIVKLLIAASVILSVVILYNLGLLNHVEKTRDFATMKVLGFRQKEIRRIAIRECLYSTIIGWILGVVAGIKFLDIYISIVSFDSFEWMSTVSAETILIASTVIVGTSLIVNLILSHKVRKIKMIESLKSVD